ncbi:DUF1361 domain-containing protein [uncultured Maribacter sp.]|uniref:DUF1361 domain-containing protein n=1 Tax=uncultured Maribacter sp. TaxID=431308 RepID=UPI00261669D1|nr:DUF1361 domain-containing protein [uncultured Maribacter sp.]
MKPTFLRNNPYYTKLLLLSFLCALALLYRVVTTHSIDFTFLLWNLFLAILPLVLSKTIRYTPKIHASKPVLYSLLILWVLFLPNSPYIITDFIHLETGKPTMWIDLFMLFIFALNGVLLGALSMIDIFYFLTKKYTQKIANYTLFTTCYLSGFGIFIGRFFRFNSWDIIARPKILFYCLYKCLFLWEAWLWIIGFGSFMWVSFLVLKPIMRTTKQNNF